MSFKPTLLALFLLAGCSRHSTPPTDTNAPEAVEAHRRAFGRRCHEDSDCSAGGVCFRRKPRPNEQQGQEPDRPGYCSMSCSADSDCPTPPTSGRCGPRKKLCLRNRPHRNPNGPNEGPAAQNAGPAEPTPPTAPAGSGEPEDEGTE